MPLGEEKRLKNIKSGSLVGYVQCDIELPKNLQEAFANSPPIFKNSIVGTDDTDPFMKEYDKKEELLTQPRRVLISRRFLEKGTISTPLLLFYLHLGLVCKKFLSLCAIHSNEELQQFLQAAVNASRKGDENSNSSVVAGTMKLLAYSFYGCQILDRSRHTVTKYLSYEKRHGAIKKKMFKRMGYIIDQLYEVELVKSEIEHKGPLVVEFYILQYAKLKVLELYYNFFDKYCDVTKFEELDMDTNSLHLTLSEHDLFVCIRPTRKQEWKSLQRRECTDEISANSTASFFPRTCCAKRRKHDRREPGQFKGELRCTEMNSVCSET